MGQAVDRVLDTLEERMEGRVSVSVETVLAGLGRRAYGPVVLVIGLVMLSPVNWIPGAGIVLATVLTLFLAQSLVREGPPWIPRRLARANVDGARAFGALRRVRPWVDRLAVVTRPRLRAVTQPPWRTASVVAIIATALSMYPLAIIPGGAGPPSLAITLFGLALTVEDGLLLLIALAVSASAFALTGWAVL
jgi:hypothetical protein